MLRGSVAADEAETNAVSSAGVIAGNNRHGLTRPTMRMKNGSATRM